MGCDIHDFVEIKVNGKWEMLGDVFETYDRLPTRHPYDGRCYSLFALLAGVRGRDILPIAEPKGIPDDASIDYFEECKKWEGDGHSHSYLTLKEIIEYPLWDMEIPINGILDVNEYKNIFGSDDTRYCAWKNDLNSYLISNREMDEYINDSQAFLNKHADRLINEKIASYGENVIRDEMKFFTEVEWYYSPRKWASGFFLNKTLPRMVELAPDGDYDRIRLVFFFDN